MQTLNKLSKGVWLKNLAITLVIVAVLLLSGHAYVRVVQDNLWESSVNNAYSLTAQGRNNLQRQVLKDYEEANLIKYLYAQNASSIDKENINAIMGRKQERKRRFIIVDADTQFSSDTDNSFRDLLRQYGNKTQGMLPVHISSQSGLSVFDIYVKGMDKQGRNFYVLKEYNVRELTNEFLLSFYDDKGFSYMVNKDGRIILRPAHPNSNKTMPNIFDTFDKETSEEVVKNLRASLAANENGWTEIMINGESTLVCYASMEQSLGWTIMTLIPNSVINAEADAIIRDTMLLLALVVLGMLFLAGAYALSYNRYRKYMVEQSYRNHWFDTLSQNSENVFLIYDANLKKTEYTFDNIYRVLGINREKVQQDIMSLCDIALDASLSGVLQQVKNGTLESHNTTTFRYRNDYLNELRQANMTIYSLDDKGDPGKYVICLTDCTEEMTIRKMLEDSLDEAQRSNQAKRAFLSAISHDVRTPLNGIMGMLEIAYMNIDDRAKLLECMGKIKTASNHLAELINQVLDMSRIESGKMSLQNANMDITELLQESVIIVQPLANNKGHELNLKMDVEHKRVLGDSIQLKQIFINLITNAIKYTENGGKINVFLRELGSQQDKKQLFELVVEDNGLGMSEEFQKHIFEPFSRVQDSTTSGIQGTGLGMAIMKRIVDLMQGQIELESSLGEGSRFTIILPLELVVEAEQESKQQVKEDLSIFKGKHVLLVDDVELNREIGEFILSSAGFEVTCLEDGKNAVAYMQNAKPGDVDLILMDLMMPIMDGYTAARLIRNLPDKHVAATPIIALTANAFEDTKQEVMAAGMNGHLAKPIKKEELYKNLAGFFGQMSTPPDMRGNMRKNKTLLFMTFLVWLVGSVLAGPLTGLAADSEQAAVRKVRVGYFEFPSYHELQEKGAGVFDSGTGYGCDFLVLLRRYANLNYEFVGYDKSWQDMLDMLRKGEIDMVTSATKNEERLKEFAFSEPIGKSMAIISVKKDDQRYHYSDYKSFDGMVLGAIVGNSRNADLASFAKQKGFSYTTKMYRTADEVKEALQRGEVDGIISSNLRNYRDEKIVASFAAHDFYAIVRKGNQKLLEEINYGIQQMDMNEGDWRNVLHYKYYASTANGFVFSQRERAYIEDVKAGRKKIVATALPDTDPYSYVENGKLVGIIPDYFAYLMETAGLPYEIKIAKDRKEFEQWVFNDSVNAFMDGRPLSPNTPLAASYGVATEPYMPLAIARANKRSFDTLGSKNIPQFVYVTKNTDHELASILSKCIKADNSGRLDELVDKYTTFDKDNFSLMRMAKHKPWLFVALLLTFVGGGIIIFLISRNNRAMRKMAASLKDKNEQLERSVMLEQQANKARREFLCNMSHDIRTPMNAIIGFTEIAKQQNLNKETRDCLEKISSSSEHLLDLINNVLDLSRIESGNVKFSPVPVELSMVTDAVLNIVTGFLANRDLQFEVQRPAPREERRWVLTDSVRLREILVNILGNAVKFTKDGGHIQLKEEILPSHTAGKILVQYTITDTGVGMSKKFMEHLFDEFTQESNDARTLYRGSGLGMAITKRYVEMMGGSILVSSEKDKGTTFVVGIPMEVTKAPKQSNLGEAEKISLEGLHVLLAEDNDLNAEIAMLQLEKQGMVVKRVENGQEAVAAFANQPADSFDVIFMDIMMPIMNGYDATKAIRSMEGRPDGAQIPIIAMTANAFAEDVEAAHAAGMDAHLAKPIDMEEVLQTLRRCLQNQR